MYTKEEIESKLNYIRERFNGNMNDQGQRIAFYASSRSDIDFLLRLVGYYEKEIERLELKLNAVTPPAQSG